MVESPDGVQPGAHGGMGSGAGQVEGLVGELVRAAVVALIGEDPAHLAKEVGALREVAGFLGVGGGLAVVGGGAFGHAEVVGEEADEAAGVGRERGDEAALGGRVRRGVPGEDLAVVVDGLGVDGGGST
ncbi:hypothetical protein GCM10020000_86860 [Streptomyces olivoverticillatus]